jgi:phytol kinase
MTNVLAVVASFVYVFAMIGIAEGLRKVFGLASEFTRKSIHVAVGMWSFGTAALFTEKWFAILPPAAFVVLNYVSYRRGLFLAMESNDRGNLGTVYFPLAFVAVILLTWDLSKPMLIAALMPMTWGDSFAAVIGKAIGRRRYSAGGSTRTVEGSVVMFVLSFASVFITLLVLERLSGADIAWAALFALATAAAATLAEAVSVRGLDNLLVPAASLGALALMRFVYMSS